jgi:hypothetical protein
MPKQTTPEGRIRTILFLFVGTYILYKTDLRLCFVLYDKNSIESINLMQVFSVYKVGAVF